MRSQLSKRQLLSEFEALLERLSIPIRYERGDFLGGLCTYNHQTIFFLNQKLPLEQKLQILRKEIQELDLEDIYLKPKLRDFLELED